MEIMDAFCGLGEDTPTRARISYEIMSVVLSKGRKRQTLVRVQRTVIRKGRSYVTHVWVRPDQVRKGDRIVQNVGAYLDYKMRHGRHKKRAGSEGVADDKRPEIDVSLESPDGINLTPEERAKLQAKLKSKKEERNRPVRFDVPGFEPVYCQMLQKRFDQATPEAKEAFDRFITNSGRDLRITVADSNAPIVGAYFPSEDVIRLDHLLDAHVKPDNPQTEGAILFHEVGHAVDYRAGKALKSEKGWPTVSDDAEFLRCLREDVRDTERATRNELGDANEQNIRKAVQTRMIEQEGIPSAFGILDLYGGVKQCKYGEKVKGHYENYWSRDRNGRELTGREQNRKLTNEAFATMYEACTNTETYEAMRRWFPKGLKRFKVILAWITQTNQ